MLPLELRCGCVDVSPQKAEINNRDTFALPPLFSSPTMAPPTSLSSHERTRVEDYLNDKIQVSADLESLDSLLSSLRAQQELQRKQVLPPTRFLDTTFRHVQLANATDNQLAEAHEALSKATKASDDHAQATRARAEAFSAEQADIDRRLKAITQSESSDEAVRRLEKSMARLQRLEVSRGYVELLKEAEELRYAFPVSGRRFTDTNGSNTARML